MPKINIQIPPQAYELILPRIADILIDEFEYQVLSHYNADIDSNFFIERDTPIHADEFPAINISLARGNYDNKNAPSADGTYLYHIDVHTRSKDSADADGDKLGNIQLQKILGLCRYILENQAYKTLGFAAPFIGRVRCVNFDIAAPGNQDANNTAMGRLVIEVVANEVSKMGDVRLMAGYDTQVKMGASGSGYAYSGNN
jgi:hypothetical protein